MEQCGTMEFFGLLYFQTDGVVLGNGCVSIHVPERQ